MVRFSGGMEAIDGFRCRSDRTVESNRGGGLDNVAVDGFRYGDERNPALVEGVGDGERPVAANDDQRVERQRAKCLHARVGVVPDAAVGSAAGERVVLVRRAQNGSAVAKNTGDGRRCQAAPAIWFHEAAKPVLEPDRFNPLIGRGLDDRANRRVQPRRVAATGQDADAHREFQSANTRPLPGTDISTRG